MIKRKENVVKNWFGKNLEPFKHTNIKNNKVVNESNLDKEEEDAAKLECGKLMHLWMKKTVNDFDPYILKDSLVVLKELQNSSGIKDVKTAVKYCENLKEFSYFCMELERMVDDFNKKMETAMDKTDGLFDEYFVD